MLFASLKLKVLLQITFASSFLVIRTSADADGDIRLLNGTHSNEGLVEIFKDGQWGTICDDEWDIIDAHVVCRQLGLGYAVSTNAKGSAERGRGRIAMDEVSCQGDEERLEDCSFRGWFLHDCVHQEDVVIQCSNEDGGIRLVGGDTLYEGRIEVFHKGSWGTVCDDSWDNTDAVVVCRELEFPLPAQAFRGAHFGEGTGEIVLSNVDCDGTERRLQECDRKTESVTSCQHSEDAGVKCNEPYIPNDICNNNDVRIVNGPTNSDGLVEVCHKGYWGTVCASSWRVDEALVICRQLGYTHLDVFYSRSSTNSVSSQIVESLSCEQNHFSLSSCDVTFGNREDCTFNAGLRCSGEVECIHGQVQLDEGYSRSSGRVQVCNAGQWHILCGSSYWGNYEARVVCRQLGYYRVSSYHTVYINSPPSEVNGIQTASCEGTEGSLSQCSLSTISSCSSQATVTCSTSTNSENPNNDGGRGGGGGGSSSFPLIEALSGGFGTFLGMSILLCTCWWCCCTGESD